MLGHKRRKEVVVINIWKGVKTYSLLGNESKTLFVSLVFCICSTLFGTPFDSASKLRGKKARNNTPLSKAINNQIDETENDETLKY